MRANEINRQLYKANRKCERNTVTTVEIINRYLYDDVSDVVVRKSLRRAAREHKALVKLQARLKANAVK